MKKIKNLLLLFVTTFAWAQQVEVKNVDVSEELVQNSKQFFIAYLEQAKAKKWNEVIDNMPVSFFEMVPKETLVDQIEKAFNNEAFTTTFNEMTFKEITSAFEYNSVVYANVSYKSSFTFHFKQSETQEDNNFETYVAFMEGTFKNRFKGQDVTRNGKNILVSGLKTILLIDNPLVGKLKMIEVDKGLKEFYKIILPEPVVAKIFNEL